MKCDLHSWYRPIAVVLALSLVACSSTNPYQRSERVDIPLTKLAKEAHDNGSEQLAGNLHGAIATLKDQRREWYDSLSTQARVRAFTQIGLLGLTAVALYSGLKSGVASDGDKKRLAVAGAVGFAAYTGSDWYVNPTQEGAYLKGIHDLTCSMLNIEPFRMTTATFAAMDTQQLTLAKAIDALDKEILQADSIYRYPEGSDMAHAKVRKEAKEAFTRARKTLASSVQLQRQIDTSGVSLMRDGDLIFADIALKINAGNKTITPPIDLSSGGLAVINKFSAVKIEPGNENPTPPKPAAPGSDEKKQEPVVTGTPDKPSLNTNTATQIPASTASKKTLASATADELATQLTSRMTKDFEAANSKLEKERANLEKARKLLDEDVAKASTVAFKKARDECEKVTPDNCATLTAISSASSLASSTAAIYATRRPLSMRLLAFDEARKTARKNVQCISGGSDMTISPSDDATVKAGQVYDITINSAPPFPVVSVNGPAAMDLMVGKAPNQFVARITVAGDAKGEVNVSISDRGLAREDVKLTVQQPAAK